MDLSTDETEEIFAIEIIYHLERGAMEQVSDVLVHNKFVSGWGRL